VLIGVSGYFSERMVDMAGRYGAQVSQRLERPWGEVFTAGRDRRLRSGLSRPSWWRWCMPRPPPAPCSRWTRMASKWSIVMVALLLADCVTSLGGLPVRSTNWEMDIAYSGTQKCVGAPPGLAPFTVGPARHARCCARRKSKVANWYLDLTTVSQYWGAARTYHHTAPINMTYASALRRCVWCRRRAWRPAMLGISPTPSCCGTAWRRWISSLHVDRQHRLPTLTTVRVPAGVDELAVRKALLERLQRRGRRRAGRASRGRSGASA
jgi:alanine-glyoxylate transaminase/serine-glyoxylate transaminase/serine-pyruvate transaminase